MHETARCPDCRRRSIVIDSTTGLLMPHFRKSGRKGGHCQGSAVPAPRAAA